MTIFHVIKYGHIDVSPYIIKDDIPPAIKNRLMWWHEQIGSFCYDTGTLEYDEAKRERFKELLLTYEGPL